MPGFSHSAVPPADGPAALTDEQREDLDRGLAGAAILLQRQNEIMARNMDNARLSHLRSLIRSAC